RRHALLGECQRVPRLFHALSLDQVQHQPRLLRRDAHVSGFSSKFHRPVSSLRFRRRRRRRHYGSRSAGHARRFRRHFRRRFHRVPLELPGKAEFPQLVPYHVLGHIYRNEFPSVVHGNRVSHHLGDNRRAPRPRPQHLLLVTRIHGFHFRRQVRIHERSFFCRTSHKSVLSSQLSVLSKSEPRFLI